jgi:enoyl-CoA hydratase
MAEHVVVEDRGAVRRLVLNRPEKLNAFTAPMQDRLFELIDQALADQAVRVIVLSGAGRAFSSGFDMTSGPGSRSAVLDTSGDLVANRAKLRHLLDLWAAPKPIIAQVHGYCIGMANDIVAVADFMVCGASARIGMPEVREFALPPTLGLWPAKIGIDRTKAILYAGRYLTGQDAVDLGLAVEVVADDQLAARVDELAASIAEVPSSRLAIIKQAVNSWAEVAGLPAATLRGAEYHALYHQVSTWTTATVPGDAPPGDPGGH